MTVVTISEAATKYCRRCGETKELREFGVWGAYMKKRAGTPRTYCRECERLNSKSVYEKRKATNGKIKSSSFVAYVTAPNGQMLELFKEGKGYKLRETRD